MQGETGTWALILAAGEGSRLHSLTTAAGGGTIPKQFCSLFDGPSLLQDAVRRAGAVAPPARTCAVVAEQHHQWWQPSLSMLPAPNVIVQPANRGTANGILLPLLHIVARDPAARVVLLPSDHHVRHEPVLAAALRRAVRQLDRYHDAVLLLGLRPEEPDPELGYIVPGAADGTGALGVRQFVEKPAAAEARELISRGALWNVFIVAATAQALLDMFRRRAPAALDAMRAAIRSDLARGTAAAATGQLYRHLQPLDFSSHILAGEEPHLRVLPVARCGWSDLGTPTRVAGVLRVAGRPAAPGLEHAGLPPPYLSLAAQHALVNSC